MGKKHSNKYDVVVGIPSYNESDTIPYVTKTVGEGIEEYFPEKKCIIVNVDNNSPDNTEDAFLGTKTRIEKKYISTAHGIRGKGNNVLNLFNFSKQAGAEVTILVDADLKSITKDWIEYLGRPIADGYDYVIPLYSRHQFDGTITNHICYPAMFGMLSMDIRQPIGGEFAFSPRFIKYLLKQPWEESTKQYGIDIFMSLNAAIGGFKICQSGLGTKIHKASAPKLGIMFEQVIETLLTILVQNRNVWMTRNNGDIFVPDTFGLKELAEPQELHIDILDLKEKSQAEYSKYQTDIKELLEPYAFSRVHEMFKVEVFDLTILLWTQIFYSLVYRYDISKSNEDRKKIINSLKSLYFARSISFNYHTWKYNVKYSELEIRRSALGFASQKYYLWGLYSNGSKLKPEKSKNVK
ncbi:glycosyltransferase, group 2 family [Candidatus Scalindua japonica]|uniref:Glycosyltransferase, group 2 family n=1 Tax=Candidatus Scalindua japonica TaxID=1284222 RepID=A0A286TYV5_9BACT|nr:glycosyltransferase [Candidatus Scalindua japonica]GAX61038.1 glycosyltransferase, group 2 family [Candidatus Scalindua japonica]